jgi:hypothetical protein
MSSFQSVIPFMASLLSHSTAISRDSLNSCDNSLIVSNCLAYNISVRTTQITLPLYCCGGVFTGTVLLHSNDCSANQIENTVSQQLLYCVFSILCLETGSSIVACMFIFTGTCLPSRCLAINFSGFQASCRNINGINMYKFLRP